jgi:hypothetical protein
MRALCRRVASGGEAVEEFAAPTLDLSLEQVQTRSDRLLDVGAAVDVCLDFEDGQPPFRSRSLVTAATPDPKMPERFDYRLHSTAPVRPNGEGWWNGRLQPNGGRARRIAVTWR